MYSFTYDTTTGNLLKKVNINGEGNYLFTYKNESSFSYLRSGFDWWGFYNEADFGDADLPNINLEIRKTTGSLNVPVNRTIVIVPTGSLMLRIWTHIH